MHLPTTTILRGGTYRIIRFISSGGFGCTYEAEHVMLEKRVAIKEFFVKDFCNRDEHTAHVTIGTLSKKGLVEKLRRKFIDEAKALCRLQHPGIVSVQDVFEENGTAYFVMDYVDGKSLSEIVKEQGPLPEERAVRYIRQVATALQYVHNNNRLHLDIKPGNIMIDRNDNPILIDFGASKQYDEEDGENTSTLMGKTPGYAPPEQMSNSVVKFLPATDIYALGATLYKLLTGITPLDVNLRISGEELEPLPTNISAATRNAIAAAMEINKNKRPQTVAAFIELFDGEPIVADEATMYDTPLQQPENPVPSKPAPMPVPKQKPKWRGGVFVVCLVAIIVVGYMMIPRQQQTDLTEEELVADSLRLLSEGQNENKEEDSQHQAEEQHKREEAERQRQAEEQRKREEAATKDITTYTDFLGDCKMGYRVKSTGQVLTAPKYDYAREFSEGLASVTLNGKCGFIDKTGTEVIPLKYDGAWSFSEGLAYVMLNGKYGFIDKTGAVVIPLKYDDAMEFSEGLAAVMLNGKWGFIDKKGAVVIPLKYNSAGCFSEGLANVGLNGIGFIDKTGAVVIPCKYDVISLHPSHSNPNNSYAFSEGLARVGLNGEWFDIDTNGNRVQK